MITFHGAEFGIIDGYHNNSGRNNNIYNVINNLYDLRLKLTNGKHPAQAILKLLMNPMFGKTIIKPVEIDTTINN